jgi:phage I-like protein
VKTTLHCLTLNPGQNVKPLFTADPSGALPMEFGPLLKWGDNATTKGVVRMGEKTRRVFTANQARLGYDEVALDYEHNTVPGTPAYKESKEPRTVAAYGVYDLRPEGLFFTVRRWTPDGMKNALNYSDLSPAIGPAESVEVEYGHSLALCRQGSVFGLKAFAVDVDVPETKTEEETMMDKVMEMLRKAMGLSATATEEDVVNGIKGLMTLSARIQAVETSLTTLTTDVGAAKGETGKIVTLNTSLTTLQGEVTTLKASLAQSEKDIACYHARLEGKVIPLTADAITKMDIKTLSETLKALPAGQVPLTPLSLTSTEPAPAGSGLSEQDLKVGRELGYTPEQMKAANNLK